VGEELDVAAVDGWLKAQLPSLQGTPRIAQCSGGASNWTYRLDYANDCLILRRPPEGTKAKSAHDMGREYSIQKALKPVFPYVPEMRAYCVDASVVGAEFYAMQCIDGIIPRKNMPRGLELTREQVRTLCTNALDVLISLHAVDYRAAGLESIGAGAGYIKRQIDGWCKRYADARTWNVPRGTKIMGWLQEHMPAQERICVIHNDFRFDNLVLDTGDPTRVIAVLDWELATLGDPLMDLGNSLAYWVQADDDLISQSTRRQPTHLPGMLTRREVVEYYVSKTGFQAENLGFYEVYGLFRLSGIVQQIYYRYFKRQSRNPSVKNFWLIVHYLHWRARKIMRASR
jgi:aminoglycoside phosphotransferase (APT) family kinase protein